MSEPSMLTEYVEWKHDVCEDFAAAFEKIWGKPPTEEDLEGFWEEYLDSDIRRGEE